VEQPKLDRQALTKNLLFSGLMQYRIEQAIKKYLDGEVICYDHIYKLRYDATIRRLLKGNRISQ
jgi:hypothetical protein